MDLGFTPAEEAFRHELRTWLEAHLPAHRHGAGLGMEAFSDRAAFERARAWHRELHAGGWVGLHWPREYGGRGATLVEQAIFQQELARAGASPGVNLIGIGMIGPTIMQWGTEAQKRRYLPPMLAGDEIWAQGFSEPEAGSDVASLTTSARLDGDHFVVTGQKVWTSGAHLSDWIELLVRTDPAAPRHQGLSCLIVDLHAPGITVRPLKQITGDESFNEVFFDDVHVPRENLLGGLNEGWMVAITTLMNERVALGGVAAHERLLAQIVDLARRVRRRGRAAAEDPGVRQEIARFATEVKAIQFSGYRRLTRQLTGAPPGPEGSAGKLAGSELALRMLRFAYELLGPYAVLTETSPHRVGRGAWGRHALGARAMTIAGGTSEIQKNILALRALGLPRK